ncbi:MAG: aminotransferase class V-fold PLP-dependent enzyme, partial [Ruminococcus sp.]|nr:aminotransferase class V-fold PLP-dependent enzyme [Ruminococcus sp.]
SLYQPDFLPDSLESGTLNVTGAMTIKAGIEFINRIGIRKIFAHEDRICRSFINSLKKNKDIIIYRNSESSYVPVVSFNVKGIMPEKTASLLSQYGYCLRAGYHCSALAHTQLGTENGTVRFSPSVFSNENDALRLAELVKNMTVSEKSQKTIEII